MIVDDDGKPYDWRTGIPGLAMIVATTPSGIIGNQNQLPWPRIKEDMKWFRKITMGHTLVYGRKTFDSIGKPLEGRTNIIVSKAQNQIEGCQVYSSLYQALAAAMEKDSAPGPFVIGGASIYEQTLPLATTIYLTEVKKEYPGDCKFPALIESEWTRELIQETQDAKFWVLRRKERA